MEICRSTLSQSTQASRSFSRHGRLDSYANSAECSWVLTPAIRKGYRRCHTKWWVNHRRKYQNPDQTGSRVHYQKKDR